MSAFFPPRWLLRLVPALLLFVAPRAHAYTVHVCIDWLIGYSDADASVGDDRLDSSPMQLSALGTKITVKNSVGATVFSGYTSDVTGCTTSFTATGPNHEVKILSEAVVNGNTVYYRPLGQPSTLYGIVWNSVNFSANGGYDLDTADGHVPRVMGLVTYALFREDLELTGETIDIWRKDDALDTPCDGTSCNTGGEIYYLVDTSGTDHSLYKNVLGHELGHKMMFLGAGVGSIPKNDNASATGLCGGGDGHQRDSIEWQSLAVIEGYAHYYASVVFNDLWGSGCGAYSHYAVNWDHLGGSNGNIYSCDAAPVSGLGLSAGDYMGDECGPTFTAGSANEYDYQRLFWDLGNKTPPLGSSVMYAEDIAYVIGVASNSPPWNATYDSSYPGSLDNPKDRLYGAAAAFGTTWDSQDHVNGVHR